MYVRWNKRDGQTICTYDCDNTKKNRLAMPLISMIALITPTSVANASAEIRDKSGSFTTIILRFETELLRLSYLSNTSDIRLPARNELSIVSIVDCVSKNGDH